jgi:DNA-binding SARP family transcriptional activator/WD40 repeat protein/energy-coupling factor transporter ATP-binding protein EcfA2
MDIGVLGPLTVDDRVGAVSPRDRAVLATLVLWRRRAVAAGTLAEALWGAEPPASAAKVVQGCIARLRKLLGPDAIETVPGGYRLALTDDDLDVARFERASSRSRQLLELGAPDRAIASVDEALALWRGAAFPDLDGWPPADLERSRLEQLRLDAEELAIEARLRAGRFREVLADGEATVAASPLRERRWSLFALALYQAGRQAEALGVVQRARRVLSDELGLDLGPELAGLQTAILRQDPSLLPGDALPDPSDACPYVGLVAYDVADADAFFGRERDVTDCLQRLADRGVVVVVGPSGSGKSSLVRAGVAAALQRQGRRVVVVTPGARPVAALPEDLHRSTVLIVDQCEEAVTLCQDGDERARFFAALAERAVGSGLVVTLRADRVGEVSAHPAFSRLVERGLFLLGRLDDDGLRAAIEGPARQAGLLVEPGLVDLLLRDVEGEPGALPLLSHALRETWQRREGRTLTVAGYRASGGMHSAVARSAEQVYGEVSPEHRAIVRDLLLRLVSPSPEGEPVRTRVPRHQVAADAAHEQVIEQLVRARLVTSDEDSLEIAHEALTRAWPRLRGWLDDDVDGQRIRRHLTAAADSWVQLGRPDSELYRGVRLARALEWRDRRGPSLSSDESGFLTTSERRADSAARFEQRRRRVLASVTAGVVAFTTVLATVAVLGQQRAVRAADLARSRELVAAAVASLETDPALAKLLAVAAADGGEPSVDALRVLHRALAEDRVVDRYRWPAEHEVQRLTTHLHPDGTRLVAGGSYAGPSTHLEVYDLERDEVSWSYDVGDPALVIDRPRFHPDGATVVAGVLWEPEDGRDDDPPRDQLGAVVLDARTGELVEQVELGRCGGMVLGVHDRSLLVQTRPDADAPGCWADPGGSPLAVELVDLDTGARTTVSTGAWGREATLSGDGRRVAVTEDTPTGPVSVVIDVATAARLLEFDPLGHEGHGTGVVTALDHDGSRLAAGYGPIVIWDVDSGEPATILRGHAGDAVALFDPDGRSVHTAGVDGSLRRWDVSTGEQLAVHRAVGAGLLPSLAADGSVLVPDPATRSAALVAPVARPEVWSVDTCDGSVWAQSLTVAGGHAVLAIDCADGLTTTYTIDLTTRQVAYELAGHRGQALATSPDGTRFVRQEGEPPDGREDDGAWHGPPQVRDLATGEPLVRFEGICTWDGADPEGREPYQQPGCDGSPGEPSWLYNWTMAWSPDGASVAVGGEGVGLAVWDAVSGERFDAPDTCSTFAQGLWFHPDRSELVAFCATEGRLVALSTETWQELRSAELDGAVEARGSMALVGHTPDRAAVLGVGGAFFHGGAGLLHWIDPDSLEVEHTLPRIHEGTPKSWAMSPDGTRLATGASDGSVKVWDVAARALVHELYVGDTQVQGLAFVDEDHLAVAPEPGGVQVYTLDAGELLEIARGSLRRGFTATECARFGFEPCPSLAVMASP